MSTSLLAQELAPLNAAIENIRETRAVLERELREVETELDTFAADRKRFDALREVCTALTALTELEAGDLFWEGIPATGDTAAHLERVKGRIDHFEGQISGILEQQEALRTRIRERNDELELLYEEVRDAYDREERRKEEFVIERELSPVPYREPIMPWSRRAESERRFRRAVLVAMLICLVFGSLVPLVHVPVPDRSVEVSQIPERLAKLVKKEPPRPAPQPVPKEARDEPEKPKDETKPRPEAPKPDQKPKGGGPEPETKVAAGDGAAKAARKKAERVGVLAFKNSFADLMDETPVAKLGTEARLSKESPRVAGQAVAQRSLVAMQATGGTSGGIGHHTVSRNVGSGNGNRIGGYGIGRGGGSGQGGGFERVESSIGDIAESSRPLSDGPGAGRTDEEIQIVFDRYKATLYRIYNKELRRDPTLRGKILLRISIDPDGGVSMCKVESTDLASPDLVAMIVERIKRFNFGPKEGVPKTTILYPIDFLPAG